MEILNSRNKDGTFKKGISISLNTQFKKGTKGYWTGKKRTEMTGEKHWNWKGGYNYRCSKCNKKISCKRTKECWDCWKKEIPKQEKHYLWKGGAPNCVDCGNRAGKESYTVKRCRKCYEKIMSSLFSGEKHWNWKGGITPLNFVIRGSNLARKWREAIFKRDNHTCQECGIRGKKLNADHIKPFAVIIAENKIKTLQQAMACLDLWLIENGRTLCVSCHRKTETHGMGTRKIINNLMKIK